MEIKAHWKDKEEVNNSHYDCVAEEIYGDINEYEKYFTELADIEPRDEETDRTTCATVKKETNNPKESERRFCRCLYYTNGPVKKEKQHCENCLLNDRQSTGYHAELIGNFKVISYEFVSTNKVAGQGVGNVDLVLADDNFVYLTEVKPAGSTETLLRMFLEIETYYRVTIRGTQYKSIAGDKPLRKAIMFFKNSEQYKAFIDPDKGQYTKDLIRLFGVTVFCVEIVDNKVLIKAIA